MANTVWILGFPRFYAFSPTTNLPLVGGKLYSYQPNTLIPQVLYTDPAGTVPAADPVILDSNGSAQLYGIGAYDLQLYDANNNLIWTASDISFSPALSVSNTLTEWQSPSLTSLTYLSTTSFSVSGDLRTTFDSGRRVKFIVTGGTGYATVSSSSFGSGVTTVTIINDSTTLDSGLSSMQVGLLDAANQSIPTPIASISALHNISRIMGLPANGPIREQQSTPPGNYGLIYNTFYNGSGYQGRDIADICWYLFISDAGHLQFYTAPTGSAGSVPTFTLVFDVNASGNITTPGTITSGNISSSGTITSTDGTHSSVLHPGGNINATGTITATSTVSGSALTSTSSTLAGVLGTGSQTANFSGTVNATSTASGSITLTVPTDQVICLILPQNGATFECSIVVIRSDGVQCAASNGNSSQSFPTVPSAGTLHWQIANPTSGNISYLFDVIILAAGF